jgi:hypothetical protein
VEIAQNNVGTLRELAVVIGDKYCFKMIGQTACFYKDGSYQFNKTYTVDNSTHVSGLYYFTVRNIKPELKLHMLAVYFKAKTKKGEG